MNDHLELKRLTRRELMRRAGLGEIGLATAGVLTAVPVQLPSAYAGDDSPEGFIARLYAQRTQAMSTGDVTVLDSLYSSSSNTLLSFEKERTKFFHSGLPALWNDSALLGYSSTVSLINLEIASIKASAELHETVTMQWIPRPVPETPERQELRKHYPEKFQNLVATGPRGEITTTFGTRHDVTLLRESGSWRLASDAYDESALFGASPDLSPVAKIGGGGPTHAHVRPAPRRASKLKDLSCSTYYPGNAVNYALAHCASGTYNANYCNYCHGSCTCNGDCTNFVSQCLNAGNEISDSTWYALGGNCPCTCASAKFVGSLAWINCGSLRSWLLSTNRA